MLVGVGLVALGVALWVGWQPATELGAVELAAAEISFSNVQVREAGAALPGTRAPITYSNVQAREALAGLGTIPASDHLQQRPAPRSAQPDRHNPRINHLQQRQFKFQNKKIAREAPAGLGTTPASITYSNVQVRESVPAVPSAQITPALTSCAKHRERR